MDPPPSLKQPQQRASIMKTPRTALRCTWMNRQQTEAIHRMQRFAKTLEGGKLLAQKDDLMKKHHNAQRLLKKVLVVIPYAEKIEFPAGWLRTRRDHQRFLNLIEVIAFFISTRKKPQNRPANGTNLH